MDHDSGRELSEKYCLRFSMIAVDMGFVTIENVKKALSEQVEDNIANRPHRLIGQILLENGWITLEQIERVLGKLFKTERNG
jgi:hypothetical protein